MPMNLNKPTYQPNEPIVVSTTVYFKACSNTTRRVLVTGYIGDNVGSTKTMSEGNIQGTQHLSGVSVFTAPATPGTHILNVKLQGFFLPTYTLTDTSVSDTFYSGVIESFSEFKSGIANNVCLRYKMNETECISLSDELYNRAYNISDINIVLLNYSLPVTAGYVSGALDYERNYDISFQVVGPTVNVMIRDSRGLYVEGPVTKSVGENVSIQWETTGTPSSCECVCKDLEGNAIPCGNNTSSTSCGSGVVIVEKIIHNVVRNIKFEVICN